MKKKHLALMIVTVIGTALLCGCVSSVAPPPLTQETAQEQAAVQEQEPEEVPAQEDPAATASSADSFCSLCADEDIEDIFFEYAVSQVEGGKYADFEGNIGDVLTQYKDVDLDGDGRPDEIVRVKDTGYDGIGYYHEITFGDGSSLKTAATDAYPNCGDIIEYGDIDGDGTNEILLTNYTDSTGGIIAGGVFLYHRSEDGQWDEMVIHDYWIRLQELADEFGFTFCTDRESYLGAGDNPSIRAAELVDDKVVLLLDFGAKMGPALFTDYEPVALKLDGGKLVVSDRRPDLLEEYLPYFAKHADYPWGDDVEIEDTGSCIKPGDERKLRNLFNAYCLSYNNCDLIVMDYLTEDTATDEMLSAVQEANGSFSDFTDHKMYVAKGYRPDSYVAFVTYQVLPEDAQSTYPEEDQWYICRKPNGDLYIDCSQLEGKERDFVEEAFQKISGKDTVKE